jgi:pimeloyl-ACP methyl ester carboxylesterase
VNRHALLGLASALCAGACLSRPPTLEPGTHALLFVRDAQLGTEHIAVHLVRNASTAGNRPLLLYATGDGGWRSADRGLFQHLARWGYPLAGFSARHYLEHLGFEATTPAHVAEDYGDLIAFAKKALDLPGSTPTVLVGFSRGSGLAVVAAAQSELQPLLGGVLAVALIDEEEYVRDDRAPTSRDPRHLSDRRLATMRPYDELAALERLPVAVIQSTEDSYLPAARARKLFGPDGERRRFYPIRAGGHTFAGAREALYEQARVALDWIVARGSETSSPGLGDCSRNDPRGSSADLTRRCISSPSRP